jgi:RimJ/RimL family protein N-acetyltransferase
MLPESLRLHDEDLVLRDWAAQDALAIEPVCGEWNVWVYTPSAARAWIDRQRDRRLSGSALALAVTVNDLPAGNLNLVRFSDDGREATLGYWLLPAARGRGLAARSARMLCAWGF